MIRLSRLALAVALVSTLACSATPTAPDPTPSTLTPNADPSFDPMPPDCRGGWSVQEGRAC
jgi:hypothetical protein